MLAFEWLFFIYFMHFVKIKRANKNFRFPCKISLLDFQVFINNKFLPIFIINNFIHKYENFPFTKIKISFFRDADRWSETRISPVSSKLPPTVIKESAKSVRNTYYTFFNYISRCNPCTYAIRRSGTFNEIFS